MDKIKDQNVYINRMKSSLLDKCWWLDKIDGVDTVVDFGCAEGDLQEMISTITENYYKYIGIDNSEEMRKAFHADGEVYASLDEALPHFDPSKSILILNSVIHEIFHYMDKDSVHELLEKLFSTGFKYIAVREMIINNLPELGARIMQKAIEKSNYAKEYEEFSNIVLEKRIKWYRNNTIGVQEFLLKYWYKENWERESKEQYLWFWRCRLCELGYINNYTCNFNQEFNIPFIMNKIYNDFGFWYIYNTHAKLLFEKSES